MGGYVMQHSDTVLLWIDVVNAAPTSHHIIMHTHLFSTLISDKRISVSAEMQWLMAWLSGSALVSINEVTLCWARLILGWVTVFGRYVIWVGVTEVDSAFHLPRDSKMSISFRAK